MKTSWTLQRLITFTLLTSSAYMVGCASVQERKSYDPLESTNRAIFSFNEKVDIYFARPVAVEYAKITPTPIQTAVRNFFSNLGDLGNFANNLLQLKITDATEDLVRFAFNSTFGIGGLVDWASPAGLPKHHEDFGLTLGHYGVPAGPYLVLPLFGPSSLRDSFQWLFAYFTAPTSYAPAYVSVPLFGLDFVSTRAELLGATNLLSEAALDKYDFVRDAYRQQRNSLLNPNRPLPSYEDEGTETEPHPDTSSTPAENLIGN